MHRKTYKPQNHYSTAPQRKQGGEFKMAVQERQERGAGYQCFSSRLPIDIYNTVNDWAWEHRLSLARACTIY